MAVTGWKYPGSVAKLGDQVNAGSYWGRFGNPDWTVANIGAVDGAQAYHFHQTDNEAGETGFAHGYGFSTSDVPSDATVDGIEVEFVNCDTANSGRPCYLISVLLATGAAFVGTNGAPGSGTTFDAGAALDITCGGAADLWGTAWTPADVHAADFGVAVRTAKASGSNTGARIDAVRVRVHYTESGAGGTTVDRTGASSSTSASAATRAIQLTRSAATASLSASAAASIVIRARSAASASQSSSTASPSTSTVASRSATSESTSTSSAARSLILARAAAATSTTSANANRAISRTRAGASTTGSEAAADRSLTLARTAASSTASASQALPTVAGTHSRSAGSVTASLSAAARVVIVARSASSASVSASAALPQTGVPRDAASATASASAAERLIIRRRQAASETASASATDRSVVYLRTAASTAQSASTATPEGFGRPARWTITIDPREPYAVTIDPREPYAVTILPREPYAVEVSGMTVATISIPDYFHGEPFTLRATVTDDEGPKTSGTLTLRFARGSGSPAMASIEGVHEGGGEWLFEGTPDLPEGSLIYLQIWDEKPRKRAEGSFPVGLSIDAAA